MPDRSAAGVSSGLVRHGFKKGAVDLRTLFLKLTQGVRVVTRYLGRGLLPPFTPADYCNMY
jgi:hypothetical protein